MTVRRYILRDTVADRLYALGDGFSSFFSLVRRGCRRRIDRIRMLERPDESAQMLEKKDTIIASLCLDTDTREIVCLGKDILFKCSYLGSESEDIGRSIWVGYWSFANTTARIRGDLRLCEIELCFLGTVFSFSCAESCLVRFDTCAERIALGIEHARYPRAIADLCLDIGLCASECREDIRWYGRSR